MCSAYRIASIQVVCVIVEIILLDLLATEARNLYQRRRTNPSEMIAVFRKATREELAEKMVATVR